MAAEALSRLKLCKGPHKQGVAVIATLCCKMSCRRRRERIIIGPMHDVAQILANKLARRQRQNPSYSLRAFARDLGLNPGTISAILNGKRSLPAAELKGVIERLRLTPSEGAKLRNAWRRQRIGTDGLPEEDPDEAVVALDEAHYAIIAEWEHYAVLALMKLPEFRADESWIARRLGISKPRVQAVIGRLEQVGFIEKSGKGFRRIIARLKTTEDVTSAALRVAHAEELDAAKRSIDRVPTDLRDLSSITLTIKPKTLPAAKDLIRRFRRDLAALIESDDATEVYQLCVQLFPITVPGSHQDARH